MTHTLAVRLPAGHFPVTLTHVDAYGDLEVEDRHRDRASRILSEDYALYLESIALGAGLDVQLLGTGELICPVDQAASVVVWWAEYGKEEMSMWEPAPDTWYVLMGD